MNLEQKVEELKKRNQLAEDGGGAKRRERQHKEGKMSARERIEFLLDEGTFEETDKLVTHRCSDFGMAEQKIYGDGFVTGYGNTWRKQALSRNLTSPLAGCSFVRPAGSGKLAGLAIPRLDKGSGMAGISGLPA